MIIRELMKTISMMGNIFNVRIVGVPANPFTVCTPTPKQPRTDEELIDKTHPSTSASASITDSETVEVERDRKSEKIMADETEKYELYEPKIPGTLTMPIPGISNFY